MRTGWNPKETTSTAHHSSFYIRRNAKRNKNQSQLSDTCTCTVILFSLTPGVPFLSCTVPLCSHLITDCVSCSLLCRHWLKTMSRNSKEAAAHRGDNSATVHHFKANSPFTPLRGFHFVSTASNVYFPAGKSPGINRLMTI